MFRGVERESIDIIRISRITNKASSRMRIETDHKEKCKVVRVPKCFKALVANLVVGSSVHKDHDEQHEVTSDTTSLRVVDVEGYLLTNFYNDRLLDHQSSRLWLRLTRALDIDEVDIVSSGVHHRPESHLVRNLPVEPNVLVGRE